MVLLNTEPRPFFESFVLCFKFFGSEFVCIKFSKIQAMITKAEKATNLSPIHLDLERYRLTLVYRIIFSR